MLLALPNLHPAVLHFPLVLAPVALAFDLGSAVKRDAVWQRIAALMWVLAAVATSLTFIAGRYAADGLVSVPPAVQPALGDHANWAQWTLVAVWITAVTRATAHLLRGRPSLALRVASLVVGLVVQGLLVTTADRGGALVYRHALAVQLPDCPECSTPAPKRRVPGVLTLDDDGGTLTWTPGPGEGAILGAVEADYPKGAEDLRLAVSGAQSLTLPAIIGAVQTNAWLDLSQFEGEVRLVHHFDGQDGGALVLSTAGGARLEDGADVLDSSTDPLPRQAAFSVSAVGGHFKGMVNGKMVVHGHAGDRAPGRVGLVFEGQGVVGLARFEAVRLGTHLDTP